MIKSNPQDDQYKIQLNLISDMAVLENQMAGFYCYNEKKDETEYKALSIRQAILCSNFQLQYTRSKISNSTTSSRL